jgi:hypothetical protein
MSPTAPSDACCRLAPACPAPRAAEEVSTTLLDAAATDAAEARAVGAPSPHQRANGRAAAAEASAVAAADMAAAAAAAAAVADAAAGSSSLDGEAPPEGEGPEPAGLSEQPMLDPRKLGLLMQLQRRWAGHQVRRHVAAAAQGLGSSLGAARSLVSAFHPFGEQWYITEVGVVPPADASVGAPLSDASLEFANANPGIINFHRMIAYRTRVLTIMSDTLAGLRRRGLRLPAPGPLVQPVRLGLILPPLVVESAAARPPLLATGALPAAAAAAGAVTPQLQQQQQPSQAITAVEAEVLPPGEASPQGGSSPAGTTTTAGPAALGRAQRRSPLAFLPGGRLKEELVPLMVRVRGRGLDMCKHVGLQAFGEAFLPVELSRVAVEPPGAPPVATPAPADGASLSAWAALSSLQHALRQRARHAAAAVAQAARGGPPAWRPPRGALGDLTLRVLLPRSVVARLASAAAAAHSAHAAGSAAAMAALQAPLVLQLRSDCQVVSVPVRLEPFVVGVVGTSAPTASFAAALLSGEAALPAAATADAAATATSAAAGAPPAAARWGALQWVPRVTWWLPGRRVAAGSPSVAAGAPAEPSGGLLAAAEASAAAAAAASSHRRQAQGEQRQRRRSLSEAAAAGSSSAPAWVEPWVAPAGPAPTALAPVPTPAAGGKHGATPPGHQQEQPRVVVLPVHSRGPPAAPPPAARSRGGRGGIGGGRPGSSPRVVPALLGVRPLAGAGKTAAVAAAPAARRRRRGAGDAVGSPSRLPAVAATLEDVQLSSDDAAPQPPQGRPPLGRKSWAAAAAGLLSTAQGLRAPWNGAMGAAPAGAPPPLTPLAASQQRLQGLASAPPAVAAARFVVLPSMAPPSSPSAAQGRGPFGLFGLLPGASPAPGAPAAPAAAPSSPKRLDALLLVTDVDSVLLHGGAGAAPLAAALAAAAGRPAPPPALALLLQPCRAAPAALEAEAEARLRELLGDPFLAVATLSVGGVCLPQRGSHGQHGADWGAELAALPPEARTRLAAQVEAARGALAAVLVRRGGDSGGSGGTAWAVPPEQRAKL